MSSALKRPAEPIAIIGIGCRFPGGASSPARLWDLLMEGREAIVEVPQDRWDPRRFYDPDPETPGKTYVKAGGFLREPIDAFDASCFEISPREASALDPQQRVLMEVAWEALEDAGLLASRLAGSETGVYIGAFMLDQMLTHMGPMNREVIGPHTAVGATMTILANRLSYLFDLRGPSFSLDTACSSSLVAVHQACQDLWRGGCSLALAGGVNVMFRPELWVAMCKGKFLAPDGRCKTFDAAADGYARGEGAGLLVLKRASEATRDGDRIWALIRASGVNQDGRTISITQPNPDAQEALVRRVCGEAGVEPQEVPYFEAHGTGTAAGDPLELRALGAARAGAREPAWVGSVKANLGHLEAAAGVAGLIKAALCLHHAQVPGQPNLVEPNPAIPFDALGFEVPRRPVPLERRGGEPLRAGVNAFGYGGTNAHALLEEAPRREAAVAKAAGGAPPLFLASARSPEALRARALDCARRLREPAAPPLSDLCYSAARRRDHHPHRLAAVAGDSASLAERLESFATSGAADGVLSGRAGAPGQALAPVFVFTGMGPQWWAMGRELLAGDPAFREVLERCDGIFARLSGWSLLEQMQADEARSRMAETDVAQPANFFLQVGLFDLWRRLGVEPAAIVGHSAGEVAAAHCAGALDLEQAVQAIYERSRLQKKTAGRGKMLAVGLSSEEARAALRGREAEASIAAVNGPRTVTLSGGEKALEAIAVELTARGTFNRFLRVEVPYHSPCMDELKPEMRRCLSGLRPAAPRVPLWSTVTGRRAGDGAFDAEYWCNNIREPTLFAEAMKGLLAEGFRTFLEIGPHPVLSAAIAECQREAGAEGKSFHSLRRGEKERESLLGSLSAMHVAGVEVDWARVFPAGRYVELPTYPWQRERFWHESPEALADRLGAGEHALLGPRCATPAPAWERGMNGRYLACLDDHKVQGAVVLPGAAYLEMALAAREELGMKAPHVLDDVAFVEAMVVPRGEEPVVRTTFDEARRALEIASRPREGRAFRRHAAMRLSRAGRPEGERIDLPAIRLRGLEPLPADELYARLAARGLQYGPRLRGLRELWVGEEELLARIEPCAGAASEPALFLDPAFLDPCLQALVALLPASDARLFLPVGCEQVRAYRPAKGALFCHAKLTERGPDRVIGQIALAEESGEVVARLIGVACAAVGLSPAQAASAAAERWIYRHEWEEAPLAAPKRDPKSGRWLLFLGASGEGTRIVRALAVGAEGVITAFQGDRFSQESAGSFRLRPGSLEDARRLLAEPALAECRGVAYLWGLDDPTDPSDAPGLAGGAALLRVAQALGERAAPARLYVVTRGAQRAEPADGAPALRAASAVGIARVAASERPALRSTLIDLPGLPGLPGAPSTEELVRELLADAADDDVALRGGRRYVRKLRAAPLSEWEERWERDRAETSRAVPGGAPFAVEVDARKPQAPARLRACRRREPGPGEVELEVHEAAVAPGWPLEVTGAVARVGAGVQGLLPGQPAAGILPAQPASSHVTIALDRAALRAHGLPAHAQVAGRLLPLVVASWSLEEAARLKAGEALLVLGDARGAGGAAAHLGRALGARVFAAAEDAGARERLGRVPGVEVLDARSCDLRREVLERTGGRGIDVLVDASGEGEPSLALALATLSRLVEVGAGRTGPSALALAALARGAACLRADPAAMLERRELLDAALSEILEGLASGALRLDAVALQAFPAAQAEEALRADAGAVSLSLRGGPAAGLLPEAPSTQPFGPEGAYLVTGGLGGFGLRVARWLVARGARRLVLAGRSGAASEAAQSQVAALRAQGAHVEVAAVDVSQEAPLRVLLKRIEAEAPLRGVFHAAAVLDDAPLEAMDEARLAKAMAAKGLGAWHLHQLTRDRPPEVFVLFSSVSALIGNPRQANYAAANCFLDALAEHRAAMGLPAVSVHWGVVGEVGMASDGAVREYLRGLGLSAMSPEAALSALERALRLGPAQVAIADVDWEALARSAPHLRRSARFSALLADAGAAPQGPTLGARLAALPLEERRVELARFFGDLVARTLQLDRARVDPDKPLPSLGVDSLLAMQLQDLVRRQIGLEVPALELLRGGSIAQLSEGMAKALEGGAALPSLAPPARAAPPAPAEALQETVARQVEGMSEAEVDAMLRSLASEKESRP